MLKNLETSLPERLKDISPFHRSQIQVIILHIPDKKVINDLFYDYYLQMTAYRQELIDIACDHVLQYETKEWEVPLYHRISSSSPYVLMNFALEALRMQLHKQIACPLPVVATIKMKVPVVISVKSRQEIAEEQLFNQAEVTDSDFKDVAGVVETLTESKYLPSSNFDFEDFCALTYTAMGHNWSFWYESDGFKVEILRLTNMKLPDKEKYIPFFVILRSRSLAAQVTPTFYACICFSNKDHFDATFLYLINKVTYLISIDNVTYDIESRVLHSDDKYKSVIRCNFHSTNSQNILFSRYLYLTESKNPSAKNKRGLITGLRNAIVIYNNFQYRISRARYFLNTDNVDFRVFRPVTDLLKIPGSENPALVQKYSSDEGSSDEDDEGKRVRKKIDRKVQSFICPYLKLTKPCLYVVYDVETVADSKYEDLHHVFCICAEYYLVHPEDPSGTVYEIKKFKAVESPLNTCLKEMEARVCKHFLQQIVDIALEILDDTPILIWKQYCLGALSHKAFEETFFNIRIVGYNSANYDDKFVIKYFDDVFHYHGRQFASRGQTVNKHLLSECHCFNQYTDYVHVSFQDIIRFTPEIASLKEVCSNLEIELPKLDFSSITFMNLHRQGFLDPLYNVMDLLIIFFKLDELKPIHAMLLDGKKLNMFLVNRIKSKFNEIFAGSEITMPTDLLSPTIDIQQVVLYYCERDVSATRLILQLISSRFHVILKNLFLLDIEGVSDTTFYSQLRHPVTTTKVVIGESDEGVPIPGTLSTKNFIPLDVSHVTDIFGYLSVAQISYTFIKCLMRARGLLKLNSAQVELIKFIKTSYFGGAVHFGFIGLLKRNWRMIDVKSEYPLCMTGPLPVYNKKYMFKTNLSFDDLQFLQEKIDDCTFYRNEHFRDRTLHLFRPHKYINFLAVLLCNVTPPPVTQASTLCCLPFPEFLTTDARSIRYFTTPQTRVLTTHHLCSLILQGWKIELCHCDTNIVFNCNKPDVDKPLNECIRYNCDDHCYLRQFVTMFGKAKAAAADEGSKVDKKLYKAILNSGAGRLGMKDTSVYTHVHYQFKKGNIQEYLENARQKITTFGSSNFDMATFINSGALYVITSWQYLLQLKEIYPNNIPIYKRQPIVAYTDTDSILYDSDAVLPEIVAAMEMSNEIGTWQGDHFQVTWSEKSKCNAAAIFGKKSYFLLNEDEKGFKDVVVHNKGIPNREVVKQFYTDSYLKKHVLDEMLEKGIVNITYQHINKERDEHDLSRKKFYNETVTKKLNVAELGGKHTKHGYFYNYSFMPRVIPSPCETTIVHFTHSPCHYLDCSYCLEWYFNLAQSLEAYNWKFDRIV